MATNSGNTGTGKAWYAGSGWKPKARTAPAPSTTPAPTGQQATNPYGSIRDFLASYLIGGGGQGFSVAEANAPNPVTLDGKPYEVAPSSGPYPSWYQGPRGADVLYTPAEINKSKAGNFNYQGGPWDTDSQIYTFRNLMPGALDFNTQTGSIRQHPFRSRSEDDWNAANTSYKRAIGKYNDLRSGGADPYAAAMQAGLVGKQSPQTFTFGRAGPQERMTGGWIWDRDSNGWIWETDRPVFNAYQDPEHNPYYQAPRRHDRNDD